MIRTGSTHSILQRATRNEGRDSLLDTRQSEPSCITSARFSFGKIFRRAAFFTVAVSLALVLGPRSSHAKIDGVDIAVEAFAAGTGAFGMPLTDTEKAFLKGLVGCHVDGKSIDTCAKEAVLKVALGQVPGGAQQFANCILRGEAVKNCAGEEFIKGLPPQTRAMARCIALDGRDVAFCAKTFATGQIETAALETLQKLKADTRDALEKDSPNSIKNIILIAQGIREDDWEKVFLGGGAEVSKAAIKIVLAGLLSPALAPIAGKITDAVVQNRFDLANDILRAAKNGDVVLAAKVVLEFYLTTYLESPCALVPDNGLKEATCGNLNKLIHAVGTAGADVAEFLLDLTGDILKATGISWLADKTGVTFLWNEIFGDDEPKKEPPGNCGTPDAYYVNNYAKCFHRGANTLLNGEVDVFVTTQASLYGACSANFNRCFSAESARGICNSMNGMFINQTQQIAVGLDQAAEVYTRSLGAFVVSYGRLACAANFWEQHSAYFLHGCANKLRNHIPLAGDPANPSCSSATSLKSSSAHQNACQRAVLESDVKQIISEYCGSLVAVRDIEPFRSIIPQDTIPQRYVRPFIEEYPLRIPAPEVPDPITPRALSPDGSIPRGVLSGGGIILRGDPIPRPSVLQAAPSGNTGGFDTIHQPRGTSVPGVGSVQPKTPSGGATAGSAANTGGFDTIHQPSGNSGNSGGFATLPPRGTSVPGVGNAQPKAPSGSAVSCPPGAVLVNGQCNSGGFDTVKAVGTSVPGVGSAQPKTPSGGISPARGINTPAKTASVGAVTGTTATGNVSKSKRNSRFFRSRIAPANSPGLSAKKQLTPNQGVLKRVGSNPGYRRGDPK